MSSQPAQLEPSELGTQQYWDAHYTTELTNHAANPLDEGTVWFDDSDAEAKIVGFLDALHDNSSGRLPLPLSRTSTSILDLGCGNGSLLIALRDAGWQGPLVGVDYSEASVKLAEQVAEARMRRGGANNDDKNNNSTISQHAQQDTQPSSNNKNTTTTTTTPPSNITFHHFDLIHSPPLQALYPYLPVQFSLITDKGTFDAICLTGRLSDPHTYRRRVLQLLQPGGLFLITSCNWSELELRSLFCPDTPREFEEDPRWGPPEGRLELTDRVEYRSFSFAGIKGQTISTVCFVKRGPGST